AFDARTAVLLAAGEGNRSRIYRTTDGGKSWVLCYTNPFPKGFFCALAFWDRNRGLAFSDPVEGRFVVIRTTDGGQTWEQVPPQNLPPAREGEYGFAASGTCLTVQGTAHAWFATGGSAARVFYSTDGGNTWQVTDTPIVSGEASTGIFSLAFRDTVHGVAVGGDYRHPERTGATVAITADGGRTWQAVEAPTVGYRSGVQYVSGASPGMLVAVGRAGCSYSVDDGRHWQNFGEVGFYTLSVDPRGGAVWAAGSGGRVGRLR
ncbi:MAG: oxidoreductase, partial [Calditrichaeota bacterium]